MYNGSTQKSFDKIYKAYISYYYKSVETYSL